MSKVNRGNNPLLFETLQTEIIKRFMSEKNFKEFAEQYANARIKTYGRGIGAPSQNDIRIAQHAHKSLSYKSTAAALGISPHRVMAALSRVGAYSK